MYGAVGAYCREGSIRNKLSGITVKKWNKEAGKYEAAVKSKDLLFDMQGKFMKEEAD